MKRRSEVVLNTVCSVLFTGAALIPPFDHLSVILMVVAAIFLGLAAWGLRHD